jgi:hypothetical protein
MPDRRKSILLRIAPELAGALQRWADDELRSLNAQIEYVLRAAVRKRAGKVAADTGDVRPPLEPGRAEGAGEPPGTSA